jgi:hypothetical protein
LRLVCVLSAKAAQVMDFLVWSNRGITVKIRVDPAFHPFCGAVAQLGERLVRNEEATGSIPVSSTNLSITCKPFLKIPFNKVPF